MQRLVSIIPTNIFGGAHNQALKLAAPLRAAGWETTVVLPTEAGGAASRLEASLTVVRTPIHRMRATPNFRTHLSMAWRFRSEIADLAHLIRQLKADVVQVHGVTSLQCGLAAARADTPIVWQILDTRAPAPLRYLASPIIRRSADVLMVTGEVVSREYPWLRGAAPLIRFVPPVDLKEFASSRADRQRPRTTPTDRRPVVGTIANRNPQKGLEYLLAAFQTVRSRHPHAVLQIRGAISPAHPAYEASLVSKISDLGLVGSVLAEVDQTLGIAGTLADFDVFVLSSVPRSEGIPTALLEAMAAGVPVVSTDVGGVSEIVEDGVTGLLTAPRDPRALATAICRVLDSDSLSRRLSLAGKNLVAKLASTDVCARTHTCAYEQAQMRHAG